MSPTPRASARGVAVLSLALLLSSCSSCKHETTPPANVFADAAPPPALTGSGAADSPRRSDPLWQRAAGEDPLERARLAEAVGAAGLLEGVEDGGEIAKTALAALPYADDADIALRRLCEIAIQAQPPALAPVLEAVLGVAGQPRRQRELLDPEGVRACGEALVAIAGRSQLGKPDRALAVSAARALAEKGYLDPGRIPRDLDP